MGRLKKLKKIRLHREGTHILVAGLLFFLAINSLVYLSFSVSKCICLWVNGKLLPLPDPYIRRRD
jgi:hypothetical protein